MLKINIVKTGLIKGIRVVLRLAKVVIPTIIFVSFLQTTTLLNTIGKLFTPLMQMVGLPGEAAIPFVIGVFTSIYGGIGAMLAIPLSPGELTILSIMISICHSAFLESAVVTEGGVSATLVFGLRFIGAFFAAWLIHVLGVI
ncbi:nucleoside recognition domain-containing protein [Sporomusa sp.]|uniref:nucleoside recognition domain-containing protein n=1 Tax=Sporomusa sp. TaxID=2078658 RepID=UPI002C296B09|nr:nucleoside recognition domain-containing protein [Sporomusa sp.]HWR42061.1 nucleoside recognition domain-containing protein [Sporomusa sp.]